MVKRVAACVSLSPIQIIVIKDHLEPVYCSVLYTYTTAFQVVERGTRLELRYLDPRTPIDWDETSAAWAVSAKS